MKKISLLTIIGIFLSFIFIGCADMGGVNSNNSLDEDELEVGLEDNYQNNPKTDPQTPDVEYGLHSSEYANVFIRKCIKENIDEIYCNEVVSPNKYSAKTFRRVYGNEVSYILMPKLNKWQIGIDLLKIAEEAAVSSGASICQIANWYRPEPYNSAVGGASKSQHIGAGAIDIQFCSQADRNKAHKALKEIEKEVPSLGIGTYSTAGSVTIHIDFNTRNYGPLG